MVLLGGGTVLAGEAMQHEVPLPASLNAIKGKRRVVTTLAWITPCNSRHQRYRGVRLQLDDHGLSPLSGMASEKAAGHHASRRGTVEHHVKSSVKAAPIASDAVLQFRVDCSNDAINKQVRVPYALVVTIEAAPQLGVDVHSEVTTRLRPRVPIDVSP